MFPSTVSSPYFPRSVQLFAIVGGSLHLWKHTGSKYKDDSCADGDVDDDVHSDDDVHRDDDDVFQVPTQERGQLPGFFHEATISKGVGSLMS